MKENNMKKALELEELRKRVDELEKEIGKVGDMVDRFGHDYKFLPPPETFFKWREEKETTQARLVELVDTYRSQNHEVIELWTSWHQKACESIIRENEELQSNIEKRKSFVIPNSLPAEIQSDKDKILYLSVQEKTAKELLHRLRKIDTGKCSYFSINTYYLYDYYDLMILE